MSLTFSITLDDDQINAFVDAFNEDASHPITADMVNQNDALKEAITEDMIEFWGERLTDDGVYLLYESFLEHTT
jgi:uncharacterized membrane-anchored protein YjiN (DUF445 family)